MSNKYQRAKRARRGDRSFQPSSAGKGDADRTMDKEAYNRGLDEVAWPGKSYGIEKKIGAGRIRITYGGRASGGVIDGGPLRPKVFTRAVFGTDKSIRWAFDWSADQ